MLQLSIALVLLGKGCAELKQPRGYRDFNNIHKLENHAGSEIVSGVAKTYRLF